MGKLINLIGKKFGRLKVIKHLRKSLWLCKCDCGNEAVVDSYNLRSGHTKSCGCFVKEVSRNLLTTHGLSKTRIYKIYMGMKKRCYNKNYNEFHLYGARGIKICDEWLNDFRIFYDWAINNGYKNNLTIDRIDTNGDYKPSNCRWITNKKQANNKRNNHYITYNNKTHTLKEWSEITNLTYSALQHRIDRGWDIEKALFTPQRTIGNLK